MSNFTLRGMSHSTRIRLTDPLATTPDLAGRHAIVTGGSSGLGLATARSLALRGADVLIGARDITRAESVRDRILEENRLPPGKITVAALDLINPDSINRFALDAANGPVDLLILNAGISSVPLRHNHAGIESQFATNHLGHFALTGHLLPALGHGTDARVVTVSSALYTGAKLNLDSLADTAHYSPGHAYSRSKLANAIFAIELNRRLTASGSPVRSFAAHPGMARTPLHATYPSAATRILTRVIARTIGREPEPATIGVMTAALNPKADPDLFWGPAGSKTVPDALGEPFKPIATDLSTATALWRASERLTGIHILS